MTPRITALVSVPLMGAALAVAPLALSLIHI